VAVVPGPGAEGVDLKALALLVEELAKEQDGGLLHVEDPAVVDVGVGAQAHVHQDQHRQVAAPGAGGQVEPVVWGAASAALGVGCHQGVQVWRLAIALLALLLSLIVQPRQLPLEGGIRALVLGHHPVHIGLILALVAAGEDLAVIFQVAPPLRVPLGVCDVGTSDLAVAALRDRGVGDALGLVHRVGRDVRADGVAQIDLFEGLDVLVEVIVAVEVSPSTPELIQGLDLLELVHQGVVLDLLLLDVERVDLFFGGRLVDCGRRCLLLFGFVSRWPIVSRVDLSHQRRAADLMAKQPRP